MPPARRRAQAAANRNDEGSHNGNERITESGGAGVEDAVA
jgi:hypothetical protein